MAPTHVTWERYTIQAPAINSNWSKPVIVVQFPCQLLNLMWACHSTVQGCEMPSGSWGKGSALVTRGTWINSPSPSAQCCCVWMGSWEGCSQLVTRELVCRWETCWAWQRGKRESSGPQASSPHGYGWVGRHNLLDTHTRMHIFVCVQQRIWQNIMCFGFLPLLHVYMYKSSPIWDRIL